MPAVQQFSWTCRDYRAGEWKWIHPWLMDLVFVLHWKYNKDEIKILSGYRTPQTNAQLEGAALNSQHVRAMALDIHIPDVDNEAVARDFKTLISCAGRECIRAAASPISISAHCAAGSAPNLRCTNGVLKSSRLFPRHRGWRRGLRRRDATGRPRGKSLAADHGRV
jgi:hypothetical protein